MTADFSPASSRPDSPETEQVKEDIVNIVMTVESESSSSESSSSSDSDSDSESAASISD